jgi:hypothetical protein
MRQFVDDKYVGERRQAVGTGPVDLIEHPGRYRRGRTSHLLKPSDEG